MHCWRSLRLVGRLGAFLPHVVMATGMGPFLPHVVMAAGMMLSVGLAGGVVAVSAITSSPTLVILSGVRESRLSPSELELSLDSVSFLACEGS